MTLTLVKAEPVTTKHDPLGDICRDEAKRAYRQVNDLLEVFVRDLGHAKQELPARFDVATDGWLEAEAKIEAAVVERNPAKVEDAGKEYIERAERYFAWWRERLGINVCVAAGV